MDVKLETVYRTLSLFEGEMANAALEAADIPVVKKNYGVPFNAVGYTRNTRMELQVSKEDSERAVEALANAGFEKGLLNLSKGATE